jgi:hypothetical protein
MRCMDGLQIVARLRKMVSNHLWYPLVCKYAAERYCRGRGGAERRRSSKYVFG